MTNETIGHYASHPGGGYQPPKSDKPKAQNPPGSGAHETPPPRRQETHQTSNSKLGKR